MAPDTPSTYLGQGRVASRSFPRVQAILPSKLGTPVFSVELAKPGLILLGRASATAPWITSRSDPFTKNRSTRSCGLNELPALPEPAKADMRSTMFGIIGLNTSC